MAKKKKKAKTSRKKSTSKRYCVVPQIRVKLVNEKIISADLSHLISASLREH